MTCAEAIHLLIDATLMAATVVLAGFTFWLVLETKSAAKKQLGVNTWLYFINRWESNEMKAARSKLALQFQFAEETRTIDDTVLDFFEQVGRPTVRNASTKSWCGLHLAGTQSTGGLLWRSTSKECSSSTTTKLRTRNLRR